MPYKVSCGSFIAYIGLIWNQNDFKPARVNNSPVACGTAACATSVIHQHELLAFAAKLATH